MGGLNNWRKHIALNSIKQQLYWVKGIKIIIYRLVIQHNHGKSPFLTGKPSINGPCSIAMLNNQRVHGGQTPNSGFFWGKMMIK
jgi:hypothetical protein